MEMDFRGLQERLRQRLLDEIAAGELTGLQLARETGFQQAHISNFLNRKRGLSLEAMDEILRARKLTVAGLLQGAEKAKARRRALQANSPEVSWIPLVDAKNCLASDVPFSLQASAPQVMAKRLGRYRPKVLIPRTHWVRFVAMRVGRGEAEAMAPRLRAGAMVVIDRHSNAVERGAMYAVRVAAWPTVDATKKQPHSTKRGLSEAPRGHSYAIKQAGEQIVVRYVEQVGRETVLRAENSEVPLMTLEDAGQIVGRVCVVIEEI